MPTLTNIQKRTIKDPSKISTPFPAKLSSSDIPEINTQKTAQHTLLQKSIYQQNRQHCITHFDTKEALSQTETRQSLWQTTMENTNDKKWENTDSVTRGSTLRVWLGGTYLDYMDRLRSHFPQKEATQSLAYPAKTVMPKMTESWRRFCKNYRHLTRCQSLPWIVQFCDRY